MMPKTGRGCGALVLPIVAALGSAGSGAVRVTQTTPANGARDVDPTTTQITITFDADMKRDGYSVLPLQGCEFPEPVGEAPFGFLDARTFVMRVKLAPGTAYGFSLNSARRRGFRSAGGSVLEPTVVRFRTRGGKDRPAHGSDRPGTGGEPDLAKLMALGQAEGKKQGQTPAAPSPRPPSTAPTKRQPLPQVEVPEGWALMDDKLFGSQVAVPPGWTPRIRGDVALCVEPDTLARASAFFVPMLLKGRTRPEAIAEGFDQMLRGAIPNLRTQTTGRPTGESVQRDMTAVLDGTTVTGSYRTVVSRSGTAFVMGYVAPAAQLEQLSPTFYRILGSYRYTGPRMQLKPFKSAAVELRIPSGWQVWTSEGKGTANQDVDWQVSCPQIPGARAFMFSPKYITPNWVSDLMTGQANPEASPLWRGKGFQVAQFTSDQQALRHALAQVMPGLEVIRQQSLEEVRALLDKVYSAAIQTLYSTGGRMTWYAFEILGRRNVQGVEMRSIITLGMSAMTTPGGIKGTLGMWGAQVRGIEAPADRFAQVSTILDRVNNSFTYTLWWIKTVQRANEHQATTIRDFWKQSNRIDRQIWDNRMETQGAISEMMYDNLTENHAFVNKETGSIEKVPDEHLERFRREDGEIVSPEEVIDKHVPVEQAKPLREAWADDYMDFDRRVQVWP